MLLVLLMRDTSPSTERLLCSGYWERGQKVEHRTEAFLCFCMENKLPAPETRECLLQGAQRGIGLGVNTGTMEGAGGSNTLLRYKCDCSSDDSSVSPCSCKGVTSVLAPWAAALCTLQNLQVCLCALRSKDSTFLLKTSYVCFLLPLLSSNS